MAAIGSSTTRAPTPAATSLALSAKKSLTTLTRAPRTRVLRVSAWKAPIRPTPSTATRRSLIERFPMSISAELQEDR